MSLNNKFKEREDSFIFERAYQIIKDNNLEEEHFFMFLILENFPTRLEYFLNKTNNSELYLKNNTGKTIKNFKLTKNEIIYTIDKKTIINNFFIEEINQSIKEERYDSVIYMNLPIYGKTKLRFFSSKIECKSTCLIVNFNILNSISVIEPLKLVLKNLEFKNDLKIEEIDVLKNIYSNITNVELNFDFNMNNYIKLLDIIEF